MFLSAVTLKIRSRSQSPNQGFNMSKCCIHTIFGQNQFISAGDIEHNITFWSKFSVFLYAVTLKIRSRSQSPKQALAFPSVVSMQTLVKIKLLVREIISMISLFGLN